MRRNGVAVSPLDFVTVGDINAGLLTFVPDTNENGAPYATFNFQVEDDGSTANPGDVNLDQSPNLMTINVNPINDAPAGADNLLSIDEDQTLTFTATDFGFSDPFDAPMNSLNRVKIATTGTAGTAT